MPLISPTVTRRPPIVHCRSRTDSISPTRSHRLDLTNSDRFARPEVLEQHIAGHSFSDLLGRYCGVDLKTTVSAKSASDNIARRPASKGAFAMRTTDLNPRRGQGLSRPLDRKHMIKRKTRHWRLHHGVKRFLVGYVAG